MFQVGAYTEPGKFRWTIESSGGETGRGTS